MELLPILRLIWRRRLVLGAGFFGAVAILVGLGGTKPVTTRSAVASTSVALDTPKSQLVEAVPAGADTLAWRASLLTHVMATGTATQELARRLGVKQDEVTVIDPNLAFPLVPTRMAQAATKAASGILTPYALTILLPDALIPVISMTAAAPSRADATRLAEAAVAVLQSQASTGGRFTSQVITDAGVLRLQTFVVGQVAPVRVRVLSSTSWPMKAIAVSLLLLLVWCAGVLIQPRVSRMTRADVRGQSA